MYLEGCKENVDCLVFQDGADYTGTVSKTMSGNTCRRWDSLGWGSPYDEQEENYCRNPDDSMSTVWCHSEIGIEEECDVKLCEDCGTATGEYHKELM